MSAANAKLNADQIAFCNAVGSVRLLAPAGCGKTHALLWRCLRIMERAEGEKPRFLIFTFTGAARDELRDRVRQDAAFKALASVVTITTLNAWGFRRLKAANHSIRLRVGRADHYFDLNNVLQPVWRKHDRVKNALEGSRSAARASQAVMEILDLLKSLGFRHDKLLTEADVTGHIQLLGTCGMGAHVISILKQLIDLEIIGGDALSEFFTHFFGFYREATQHLFQSSLISFEDQKYWAWIDIEQQISRGTYWGGSARYHHILVDEFQDINPLDLGLLRAVADINKAELTVIGDDDQAIYEWRAATPHFILNPEEQFKRPYTTVILGTNYRSPKNIVDLSQLLINHNRRRVPKVVVAASKTDALVEAISFSSLSATIDYVVETVTRLLREHEFKNVALIGRKRSQIIPYQIVFAAQGIPFYAAEDLHVFLSDAFNELKELLAIRARATMAPIFGANPARDILALCDKVKRYKLSKKDKEALQRFLIQHNPRSLADGAKALFDYSGPLKGDNAGGRMAAAFADAITALLTSKTVAASISAISDNFEGLQRDYGKGIDDIFYTDPPFAYLSDYAVRYGDDYQAFYEDIDKAAATLARIPPEDEDDNSGQEWKLPLHMMTALRAKGKEFDAVFILDANNGIWPSKLAQTEDQLEAERRLFYVAVTRVRKQLTFLVDETICDEAVEQTPYLAEMGLSIDRTLDESATG